MASTRRHIFPGSAGSSRVVSLVAVVLCAVALAGCFTGQRPSFDDDRPLDAETGDPAVDAVLARLDAVAPAQFTADYEILTRLGGVESTATVVQGSDSRRSITINQVRFIDGEGTASTCDLSTGECEATLNDARVSNVQLNHDFYASSFARRLRVDAGRRIGDTTGYEITQAGQQALCVDVPVSGGTVSYCALESGPLARYDGNDVFIEMTSYATSVDESAFTTG